jgi:hypothetical protein
MSYDGGCQCGKIRYRADGPADRASVCYCRMCQRAAASPYMAFVRFRADAVHWSSPPAIFASSNLVERGFCRDCGTPLSYRQIHGPWISLTIASLDDPEAVRPSRKYSAEAALSWSATLADLPDAHIDISGGAKFISHQHEPIQQ